MADEVGTELPDHADLCPGVESDLTDDELTALALAADPEPPLARDAVPLSVHLAEHSVSLPQWYMPPVMARRGKRWRTPVVLTIVVAFLVIEAVGLCSTYGQLVLS